MKSSNTNSNWKYDYAFVSSGKYLYAFLELLVSLLPGELRKRILVVPPRPSSNVDEFEEAYAVTTSTLKTKWYSALVDAKCIILLVTPGGVGNVLAILRKVKFDLSRTDQHLISFSSGTTIEMIKKYCQLPSGRIAIATGNTNVRIGLGRISYFAGNNELAQLVEESLSVFGLLTREDNEAAVLPAITTWGADNALNAKFLWLAWFENNTTDGVQFLDWMKQLQKGFDDAGFTLGLLDAEGNTDTGYQKVFAYLDVKSYVLEEKMNYFLPEAMTRVWSSLKSTLDTLIASEVNSYEGIKTHIKGVATQGGNTEKGLVKVATTDDLCIPQRCADVVGTMYEFSKTFAKTAEDSIPDALNIDNGVYEQWLERSR